MARLGNLLPLASNLDEICVLCKETDSVVLSSTIQKRVLISNDEHSRCHVKLQEHP